MNEIDPDVVTAMRFLPKGIRHKVPKPPKKRSRPVVESNNSPFMKVGKVLELVPISKSLMYMMIAEGQFPKPKQLGPRAVAWSRAEVNAWIAEKLK